MVDISNGWQEYFGTFDISSGSMNQISISTISSFVNNGTTPVIDPINRKYIYSSSSPGPVIIIDLDNGTVVNSFSYSNGFYPRHFAYLNNEMTGISEENIISTFEVYPNPTSHQLSIVTDQLNINEVHIIDITGKIVKKIILDLNSINVADLNNGIYIIRVITEKDALTKKFVKQ